MEEDARPQRAPCFFAFSGREGGAGAPDAWTGLVKLPAGAEGEYKVVIRARDAVDRWLSAVCFWLQIEDSAT